MRASGRPAAVDVLPGPALGRAEFARLMEPLGPWGRERRVAVAVSGGADSLCLAWLAAGWGRPYALIVDHGLRAGSAAEAAEAACRLAGFGVGARILRLHGLAHGPGLAARARQARYAALQQAAAAEGLSDLLLGHHAGDQAETVLIRRDSGSGLFGQAAMAAVTETTALRLVRPLLKVAPDRLRATLLDQRLGWAEDPGNDDRGTARGRARAVTGGAANEAGRGILLQDALHHAISRAKGEKRNAAVLASRASLFPEGYAVLTPGEIAPGCLAALIRALSGTAYPARSRSLSLLAAGKLRGTLGGLRFMPAGRLGPGTLVVREEACMAAPVEAGDGAVWDRRFVLQADGDLPDGTTVAALGDDVRLARGRTRLPSAVLRTLPALRAPGHGLAVPHLGFFNGWTNGRVGLTLHPANPVCGAAFTQGDAQRAAAPHVLDRALAAHRD